jgi:hypothetical protein
MEEQISSSENNNRQSKRLKVGRACYTCRAKKIKVESDKKIIPDNCKSHLPYLNKKYIKKSVMG